MKYAWCRSSLGAMWLWGVTGLQPPPRDKAAASARRDSCEGGEQRPVQVKSVRSRVTPDRWRRITAEWIVDGLLKGVSGSTAPPCLSVLTGVSVPPCDWWISASFMPLILKAWLRKGGFPFVVFHETASLRSVRVYRLTWSITGSPYARWLTETNVPLWVSMLRSCRSKQ